MSDKCPKCGAATKPWSVKHYERHPTIPVAYECGSWVERFRNGDQFCEHEGCLRRQLAQEKAKNERLRELLRQFEWRDDLDETACPTGYVECPLCEGGGWLNPGRGRKRTTPTHVAGCPLAAALEGEQP